MPAETDKRLFSFGRYKKSLSEALTILAKKLDDKHAAFQASSPRKKILYAALGLASCAGIVAAGMSPAIGVAAVATQGIGFAGYMVSMAANRLKENHHTIALDTIGTTLITTHKLMLNAWSYSILAGLAAIRGVAFSLMPSDANHEKMRKRVGLGFACVGLPLMGLLAWKSSAWSLLNMASMALNIWADTMISNPKNIDETKQTNTKKDKSHYARLCRTFAKAANLGYSTGYSMSIPSMIFDSIAIENQRRAITAYDFPPKKDENGVERSLVQRTWAYLRLLWKNEIRRIPAPRAENQQPDASPLAATPAPVSQSIPGYPHSVLLGEDFRQSLSPPEQPDKKEETVAIPPPSTMPQPQPDPRP